MYYQTYDILWLFLVYSFAGWLAETALAAVKKGRLLNRGFLSLPFSPIYGCGWALFALFLPELKSQPFFLFLGGMILSAALELFTGVLLKRLTGRRWWDYSGQKFQFEGYICLPYTLIWGGCALLTLLLTDGLLLGLVHLIPAFIGKIILAVLYVLLGVDFLVSITTVLNVRLNAPLTGRVSGRMKQFTRWLDNAVTRSVQKRVSHAYPTLSREDGSAAKEKDADAPFAAGLCLYKLAALFFIAAFLGAMTEMLFCRITGGTWMSRSSVVWGQFSIVWGLGAAMFTAVLYKHRHRSDSYIFLLGTVLGGAYEYICSVFTEIVFGTVFWDYSDLPFNLGGRINLLYCFFWGIAAVVWLKVLYPHLSHFIESIPKTAGKWLIWGLSVFMLVDVVVTSLAMVRYNQRQDPDAPPCPAALQWVDDRFPDERIESRYPNLMMVEE